MRSRSRSRSASGGGGISNAGQRQTILRVMTLTMALCCVGFVVQLRNLPRTPSLAVRSIRHHDEPALMAHGNAAPWNDEAHVRREAAEHVESYPRRGILMCLHEGILALGLSLIRELRCLGNTELVEVYHCNELPDLAQAWIYATDTNVRVIDLCSQLVDEGRLTPKMANTFRSYWIKPLAVHETNLSEIILLDADVILLRDPAVLREIPGYQQNGTVFFYDRVVNSPAHFNKPGRVGKVVVQYLHHWLKRFDYARFNTTYGPSQHLIESFAYRAQTAHEQDSSMLLIDKRRAGTAMDVLWFLITNHRFKFNFSWGDKEAFWLSYEFSHTSYFFSPWGASVVSSTPNRDMEIHPTTLCGSLAHFTPVLDDKPELFYVNGKALVDPVPFNASKLSKVRRNHLFNMLPTHMTPRHTRVAVAVPEQGKKFLECLTGLGATLVPPQLHDSLWRRRMHFLALSMNRTEPLAAC